MPLEKIVIDRDRAWGIWQINEEEEELSALLPSESIPSSIHNSQKRCEHLGARILAKEIAHALGLTYDGIIKDVYGKPFLQGHPHHLSLSHSYPYVAALVDRESSAGIDLEQPKEKLLRIAARILHQEELVDAGADLLKHCVYWCAKEALIKFHGKKDLIFAENLLISPFSRKTEGDITGRIIVDNVETIVPLYYMVYPNFVMVFNKRSAR
jgi:4'-phosphopantetheinyl transferase